MTNKKEYQSGVRDGIPIALGYFAVSFTFGMMAVTGGLKVVQAVLTSLTNVTSAGQFAALAIILGDGSYLEMILTTLVINLRYSLMSFAVSQKIDDKGHGIHRYLVAFGMTDEIFGICINHGNKINPFYNYGAMSVAIPGWCLGTLLGAALGNVLPAMLVSALSIAIYGMFLAIIIPPAEKNHTLYWVVGVSMLLSTAFAYLPILKRLSGGFVIIIITVLVSAVAAVVQPLPDPNEEEM